MSDDIQALTAQLASDPASLVFLELAEALRRRRQLDAAAKVARAGLSRYPDLADAHDLLGRILADRGEAAGAADAWAAALALDPAHVGANKGMAFLLYHSGDAAAALDYLRTAARAAPDDAGLRAAIARVRAEVPGEPDAPPARVTATAAADAHPLAEAGTDESVGERPATGAAPASLPTAGPGHSAPTAGDVPPEIEAAAELIAAAITERSAGDGAEPPGSDGAAATGSAASAPDEPELPTERSIFAGLDGANEGLLLLDRNGMRLGGGLRSPDGEEVGDTVAAHLSGVSREAERAARLLGLGALESVAAESPDGNLYLLAPSEDTVLLTVRDRSVPVGRLALVADRAAKAARTWLERLA
jgi:predicted regulator of Ras-like GTPase activity (Roadblock/LC7/MglB family)/tetratricopeptide (TPR) repeat protein